MPCIQHKHSAHNCHVYLVNAMFSAKGTSVIVLLVGLAMWVLLVGLAMWVLLVGLAM